MPCPCQRQGQMAGPLSALGLQARLQCRWQPETSMSLVRLCAAIRVSSAPCSCGTLMCKRADCCVHVRGASDRLVRS